MAQSFSAGAELLTGEAQNLVRAADALQYAVGSVDAETTAIAHGRSGPPLEVWLSLWDQRLSAWTEVIAGIREAADRVASIAASYADTAASAAAFF
ncbi:hypothetical protein RHCRD62_110111 [Rhodococcus sp. RD6.2]|uniref:hypothetical protein n=1 Tax=Rhodococcus sp. RD6.2 TaxID=260936 RepID=UPI00063B4E12|nr:hypothetical protein [Rhodococcus sp. RD6.2]CRK50431.1 hypothetical protein RHCRD62_110111 [Rhodococcus sp. RD6.2]